MGFWLLGGWFATFTLWKVSVIGVNWTGASIIGQLLLTYGLDRWRAYRDWKNDPMHTWIDDNGMVRQEKK